jgi:ParB family chromosome partitioning protein
MSMSKREKFRHLAEEALTSVPLIGERGAHLADDIMAGPFAGTSRLKGARLIPIERLVADPSQPRKTFSAKSLADLASSIEQHGILQPLLVQYDASQERYLIVAGERRYRAAQLAGVRDVPCVVVDPLTPRQRLYYQLVENLQRDDISPFEEADAFRLLVQEFRLTHYQIAQLIGKSRTYISKTLKLSLIPDALRRRCVESGLTSREHLLAISQQPTPADMEALLNRLAATPTNVKTLRRIKPSKGTTRRRPFQFHFAPEDRSFSVTVSFKKYHVSKRQIARALTLAIESLAGDDHS